MANICAICCSNMDIVGRVHRCVPVNQLPVVKPAAKPAKPAPSGKRRGPMPGSGGRPKKGMEHESLKARMPWVAAGVSQRTWYRQRKSGQ